MKKSLLSFCLLCSFILAKSQTEKWQVLFDGKTLSGWKQGAGNAPYTVENGCIVGTTIVNSPNSFLITEKTYGDFVLELEARVDDTSSNTGIQIRSHINNTGRVYGYQCEIDPSSRKWTGGIYDEGRRDWLYPMQLNPKAQNAFVQGKFNKIKNRMHWP